MTIAREHAEHVLDWRFVVRKYEGRDYGEFRTKRLVLDAYDTMAQAAATDEPFVSPLDRRPATAPPPGA